MAMSVDQVLDHLKESMAGKEAVVAAPGGQPPMPPGMDPAMMGGGLPPVGASPGGAIDPVMAPGAAPPMMDPAAAGMAPPPPEAPMPPEGGGDPVATLQQEVSELRGLMQQIVDGQAAIIEHLIGGSGGAQPAPAAPAEAPPVMASAKPDMEFGDDLIGSIQQELRG